MYRQPVTLTTDQFKRYKGIGHVFIPYRIIGGWLYRKVYVNPSKQEAFYWKESND